NTINIWRFEHNLDFVTIDQVYYHLFHRLGALLVLIGLCLLNYFGIKTYKGNKTVMRTLYCLDGIILLQITLGIATVLSLKGPFITSLHVVTGAATLGLSFLLLLRTAPLSFKVFKEAVFG
ncbi:MAG: COX15/CtaA family protein, partial [Candidatus Omnitrophica bacterium]|nr:COX15/CtaA family protein [Candidatus Omnitrophota bacterium]